MFRDITTLLKDPVGLRTTVNELCNRYTGQRIDKVVAIDARGFVLGAPLAYMLGTGFIPVRKKGKLPGPTMAQDYALEYGTDTVEIHTDAISPGDSVVLVDDLIATGGTADAALRLIRKMGGNVLECAFIIDLPELGGRKLLEQQGYAVHTLVEFEGE
jgi:adenine phosphoribosyltransferase